MPQQLVTNCICNDSHKNEIQLDKRVTEPFPINHLTIVSMGKNSEADLLTSCRLQVQVCPCTIHPDFQLHILTVV